MTSTCVIRNDTQNVQYLDIYKLLKFGGDPPPTHTSNLTWEELRVRLEGDGFRECQPGRTRSSPNATLSWPLKFGGYEITHRDAWGRPSEVQVFQGWCKTGALIGQTREYNVSQCKQVTHTITLRVPPVGASDVRQRYAPSAPDVDLGDIATNVKLAALAIGSIVTSYMFLRRTFWGAPPAPQPQPAQHAQPEQRFYEVVDDDDDDEVDAPLTAPRPSQRRVASQGGNGSAPVSA